MKIDIKNRIIKSDMEDIYHRSLDWNRLHGKTVFISGAYGMLASYIVCFLMYLNMNTNIAVDVIAQGRDEKKAKEKFETFWNHERFRFYSGDILCAISDIPKVDYIIHAAGIANPRFYTAMPVEVIEPNVIGTYHLLKLAERVKCSGFLFFSTGDIYGKVISPEDIDEKTMGMIDPLEEHSCYGESKRLGETLCVAFCREHGIPVKMARIGHTYGPTMDINYDSRVFASFVKCIIEGNDIDLYSDGRAKRPFCYIADAVAAFFLLLFKGGSGEAYNVTNTEQFISVGELAEILASISEKKVKVTMKVRKATDNYLEAKFNQENKPSEAKLRNLGWETHYDVRSGFERVYHYFKDDYYKGCLRKQRNNNENV